MKCDVCGAVIMEGSAECGRCGYPVIIGLGDSPVEMKKREELAEQYRAGICRDIEVGFFAYTHKIVKDANGDEKLALDRSDKVFLCTCGALAEGQIMWHPEGFVRPKSGKLDCRIYIRRKDRTEGTRSLSIPLRPGSGDIRIGVRKLATAVIQICIGGEHEYMGSEPIPVLA